MIALQRPLFGLGKVVATPGAIAALQRTGERAWHFLVCHLAGNWGIVDAEDKQANDDALKTGGRLLSVYETEAGEKIWIITEADRSATTLLLPDEY